MQIVFRHGRPIVIAGQGGSVAVPIVVTDVTISGTAVVGQTLTVSYTITGAPTVITRRWYRGVTLIHTSTSSDTYVLTQADAGQNITCVVDADNVAGSASATSNTLAIMPQWGVSSNDVWGSVSSFNWG